MILGFCYKYNHGVAGMCISCNRIYGSSKETTYLLTSFLLVSFGFFLISTSFQCFVCIGRSQRPLFMTSPPSLPSSQSLLSSTDLLPGFYSLIHLAKYISFFLFLHIFPPSILVATPPGLSLNAMLGYQDPLYKNPLSSP